MGIDLGNSLGAIIGSGAGMIGGGITGFRGTPDQYTYQDQTQETTLKAKDATQRAMEQQSYQQYLKQLQATNLQQQIAQEADPLRQAALQQQLQVISGEAFGGPSEQELGQINQLRSAMIGQGQDDIQKFLTENMRQTVSGAASRGLRGQALAELEGRVLETGNEQFGNLVQQANLVAAQNAISLPQQRMAMQNQAATGGLNYAQLLQQQALQNRNLTQNPYLLTQLQNERLQTASQKGNVTNMTPGQKGGFWNGITGMFGGMAAGAGAGQQMQQAFTPAQQGYVAQQPQPQGQQFAGGLAGGNAYSGMGGGGYGGMV